MNSQCEQLLNRFCNRYALLMPEPDEQGRYQLGFDQVEVSLFEYLGRLYLVARLASVPEERAEREQLIEKTSAYLFRYLYTDECVLNLVNEGEKSYLVLVVTIGNLDTVDLDTFEPCISALVNRAESLAAHLNSTAGAAQPNRLSVFRP